jgi:hypothetical protein
MLRSAVLAFAIAAYAAVPAHADPAEELDRIRDEAAQMRRSLDRLDARIRELEREVGGAQTPPGAASAPSVSAEPPPLVLLQRSWSQIERGLPADRVEALLGKPGKLLSIDGSPVWYYAYPGLGRGSVFFDRSGRVSGVQPPISGWSR